MAVSKEYQYNVFVNCPFDPRYRRMFRAVVFSIIDCGFIPKCGLELPDASVDRMAKLFDLMAACRLGIHDISRTQLDSQNRLPRFNMPLELGMFLGAKRFGLREQKKKYCMILDTEKARHKEFISDIDGKEVTAHANNVSSAIRAVRDWLGAYSKVLIPGAEKICEKYSDFLCQLPQQCKKLSLVPRELTFVDYRIIAEEWLDKYDEEADCA